MWQISKEVVPGVLEKVEQPRGILKVTLVEAVNVPKSDLFSSSDPYVM
jgi:hypothetical protein